MRRYATVIAVVLGLLLLLSGGHLAAAQMASTTPDQSYGGEPLKAATATVAPKQAAVADVAKTAEAEAEAASAEDAAAALVTGFTAGAENSSPEVTAAMKPVLEKTDAGQFYQDVPWIPDPNDESGPSKTLPAAQVMPVMPSKGGGSPPTKAVEVDYYASTQPKKPEEPPTVAAVQKDCTQAGKAAADYGTSMPAPVTPSAPSKGYGPATPSYSSPAAPGVVSVQPSTPAVASSSKPPSNDPYSPAAEEQKDGLNEKAISDIVKEHNMFRTREHVPPIEWNATLAKYAQEYAEQRRGDCQLEHSHGPYGENMMFGTGKEWTWKKTVDEWSDEKKSYDYKSNSCKGGQMCTHYTAVVWKNTTGVGCGRVVCSSGDTIMVCSYWPPGNYIGVKPY